MNISACLIVKNEEKNIKRCIESYKSIVNQIVVVDTGSTDNTVKIARKLGAEIYHYKWDNNFANARNFALSKARGSWIIFLDADEYFEKDKTKNIPSILKIIDQSNLYECILCKLINLDEVTGAVQDINNVVRIFKNSPLIRYKNKIHETISKGEGLLDSVIVSDKDLVIYHTGYSSNIIKQKLQRNVSMLKEELNLKDDPITYFYLCDCYISLGEYELAIETGKRFINSNLNILGFNSKPYRNIIVAMIHLNYPAEEIRKILFEAKNKFKKHPTFYYYAGLVDYMDGQFDSAFKAFSDTIKYHESYNDIEINDIPSIYHGIHYYMGLINEHKGDLEAAQNCYIKSLKSSKGFTDGLSRLINLIKERSVEDITSILGNIYNVNDIKDSSFLSNELSKLEDDKNKNIKEYLKTMI